LYNLIVLSQRRVQLHYFIPLLAVVARLIPGPRTIDDAYITFRYAQNLIEGNGLVYNPGEGVLGTTTPAYALILALVGLVFGGSEAPFPVLALGLNSLLDGLSCVLLLHIAEKLGYSRAGWLAALIWAVAPWSVTFAIGGMETSLAVASLLGTLYLYLERKPVHTAAIAALGVLVRPDTLLFSGIVISLRAAALSPRLRKQLNQPQPTHKEVVAFVVPLLVWSMYALGSYGNPLPNSLFAKAVAYRLSPEEGLIRFLQHYGTLFLGHLHIGTRWLVVGILLYPTLFLVAALNNLKKSLYAIPFFTFPWIYFAAYVLMNPLIFRWYLTPPLPFLLLGVFIGLEHLAQAFSFKPMAIVIGLLAFTSTLLGWELRPDHGQDRPAPQMAYIKLELLYEQVAMDLKGSLNPESVLSAGDVGALGYFSGATIHDTVGLISPRSIPYYPLPEHSYAGINYAIPTNLILDESPDFLVILEVYGRNTLLKDPAFLSKYTLNRTYPTDIYGSEGMLVYQKVSE
jgi:hypothetical protein